MGRGRCSAAHVGTGNVATREQLGAHVELPGRTVPYARLRRGRAPYTARLPCTRRAPERARDESIQNLLRRVLRRSLPVRRSDQKNCTRARVFRSVLEGLPRRLQILLGVNRRKEERLGGVVEAFATSAVGGQRVAGTDLDVQKVADCSGILLAIQPSYRRGSGNQAHRTSSIPQRACRPRRRTYRARRNLARDFPSEASRRRAPLPGLAPRYCDPVTDCRQPLVA